MKRFLTLLAVLVSILPRAAVADDQTLKLLVGDQARGLVLVLFQMADLGGTNKKAIDAAVANPARAYTPVYQYGVQNRVSPNLTGFDLYVGYAALLDNSLKRLELTSTLSNKDRDEWSLTRLALRNPDAQVNQNAHPRPTKDEALSTEFFSDKLLGQTLTSYKSSLGDPTETTLAIEPGQLLANGLRAELVLTYKGKIQGSEIRVVASGVRTKINNGKVVTDQTQTTISELSLTVSPVPGN